MGLCLTEIFETPDRLAWAGIERVADDPMDDRTFEMRAKHASLASIP